MGAVHEDNYLPIYQIINKIILWFRFPNFLQAMAWCTFIDAFFINRTLIS